MIASSPSGYAPSERVPPWAARTIRSAFDRHRRPFVLHLLKTYKPSGLAAYFLATPVFGVLQSWLVLGEAITIRLMALAVLVVGGIALASRPSRHPGRQAAVTSSPEEV